MSDIYKINYLSKDTIDKIIVFCGTNKYKDYEIVELNKLFDKDKDNVIFQEIFHYQDYHQIYLLIHHQYYNYYIVFYHKIQ